MVRGGDDFKMDFKVDTKRAFYSKSQVPKDISNVKPVRKVVLVSVDEWNSENCVSC